MARKVFTLNRNKDNTVTFKSGSYVESFSLEGKGMYETYESIKFAAICAGIPLGKDMLEELLHEARGLHE